PAHERDERRDRRHLCRAPGRAARLRRPSGGQRRPAARRKRSRGPLTEWPAPNLSHRDGQQPLPLPPKGRGLSELASIPSAFGRERVRVRDVACHSLKSRRERPELYITLPSTVTPPTRLGSRNSPTVRLTSGRRKSGWRMPRT